MPSDTLSAVADALLRSAAKNLNSGTSQTIPVKITVGEDDTTRAIIKFDHAAIAVAVGSGTLTAASLELPVKESGANPAGNDIDVHRVLKPWTEAGVTWKCGEDLNTANVGADCPSTKWKMSGADMDAFVPTRTARVHLNPGQTGVARFDVTSDVQAFLAGGSNHGWLVNAGSSTSRALFWSREATLKPHLVLSITETPTEPPPIPDQADYPDDSAYVISAPDAPALVYYRRLMSLAFLESATSQDVVAFFQKYAAQVVGGIPNFGVYYIQVSDPGSVWTKMDSVLNAMNAEPGVEVVAPLIREMPKGALEGRYPADGTGFQRANWFDATATTWALRAIRAPLAWGCENGVYGGVISKIGLVEQDFTPNPDLQRSQPIIRDVPAGRGGTIPTADRRLYAWHGTAVAGALAAEGDNGEGTVGATWQAGLIVYTLVPSNARFDNDIERLSLHLNRMGQDQIRVLSISSEIDASSTTQQNRILLVRYLRQFLRRNPGVLIVKSVGDDEPPLSAAVAKTTWKKAIRSALAQLREEGFASRIILVAGTAPGNEFWSGSSFIQTMTDVAAPGVGVGVLGLNDGQGDAYAAPVVFGDGTSFSAPLVAGVAAQLLAMDPTLTPAEVKDYILRGAQSDKVDPASGELTPAAPVVGSPGPVYQLDAYGALTLLSRERQGTPICGLEVWSGATLDPGGTITGTVFLGRNAVEPVTLPTGVHGGLLSVAQGGRLLAAQGFSDTDYTQPLRLMQGAWEPQAPNPAFMMYYLERDTAYLRFNSPDDRRTDLFVRIGSHYAGRSVAEQRVTAVAPSGDFAHAFASSWHGGIAPTGDWILFDWGRHVGDNCANQGDTHTNTLYAVPLRGGSAQTVLTSTQNVCAGGSPSFESNSPVAWRNDGTAFVVTRGLFNNATQQRTMRLRRFTVSGSTVSQVGTPANESGVFTRHVKWDPEGGRIRLTELTTLDGSQCNLVFRRASNLADVLNSAPTTGARCSEERTMQPAVRVASNSE